MADDRIYVKFGPGDTDEVPLVWAERMLTVLHEKYGTVFGTLLQLAAGIEPKTRKRAG